MLRRAVQAGPTILGSLEVVEGALMFTLPVRSRRHSSWEYILSAV